jgi:RimJ/RimL family protein N-acetyltransferase
LLARAEEIAAAHGVRRLRLYALAGNKRARRVYEEAGFSIYGVEMIKSLHPKGTV